MIYTDYMSSDCSGSGMEMARMCSYVADPGIYPQCYDMSLPGMPWSEKVTIAGPYADQSACDSACY